MGREVEGVEEVRGVRVLNTRVDANPAGAPIQRLLPL